MTPDATVWEDIRRAYEHSELLIPEILKKFDIDEKQLAARRKAEGWTPRTGVAGKKAKAASAPLQPEPAAQPTSAKSKLKQKSKPPKPPTATQRRAVVARLSAAIDKKLGLLERRMEREITAAEDEPPTSADIERDIRAIGALMKNLEQATDNDRTAAEKSGRGGKSGRDRARDAAASADAADRIRRELGERLQRLVEAAGKDT